MSQNINITLDLKDRKLLYELSKNARIPLKSLAKKIRLSESSTSYRLNNLIKEKIILGTQTIIDHSKLGLLGFRIYFKFFGTTTQEEEEILNWLKSQKEINVLGLCFGSIDIAILSYVRNPIEFHNLIMRLKEIYRDKITDIQVFNYLRTIHFNRNYLIDLKDNVEPTITGGESIGKIDELDKKIINSIIADARKSVLQIAKEIKSPAKTVATRLKKLEEERIIVGYGMNLNLEKIGYTYYKLNIIANKNINYNTLVSFASNLKNSIYIDETLGKYDFEINLEVKNEEELYKIIDELKNMVQGINQIDMFQIKKYIKLTYANI